MAKAQVQLQKRVEKKEVEYPTVAQVVREVTKPIVTPDLRENDRVVLDALIGVHHATRIWPTDGAEFQADRQRNRHRRQPFLLAGHNGCRRGGEYPG